MTDRLPCLKTEQLLSALKNAGFESIRQRGSHRRLRHPDGRVVTVSGNTGEDIGRGLLRKILRDADISREELLTLL
jgi:predicted RNA binding protein YcfA (HicA-like mRNA interferase family)